MSKLIERAVETLRSRREFLGNFGTRALAVGVAVLGLSTAGRALGQNDCCLCQSSTSGCMDSCNEPFRWCWPIDVGGTTVACCECGGSTSGSTFNCDTVQCSEMIS